VQYLFVKIVSKDIQICSHVACCHLVDNKKKQTNIVMQIYNFKYSFRKKLDCIRIGISDANLTVTFLISKGIYPYIPSYPLDTQRWRWTRSSSHDIQRGGDQTLKHYQTSSFSFYILLLPAVKHTIHTTSHLYFIPQQRKDCNRKKIKMTNIQT